MDTVFADQLGSLRLSLKKARAFRRRALAVIALLCLGFVASEFVFGFAVDPMYFGYFVFALVAILMLFMNDVIADKNEAIFDLFVQKHYTLFWRSIDLDPRSDDYAERKRKLKSDMNHVRWVYQRPFEDVNK